MDNIEGDDNFEIASMRVERALERLEKNIASFAEDKELISKLQSEIMQLSQQKNEYITKFEQSVRREQILDESAKEVSQRLVGAMETIRAVLVK